MLHTSLKETKMTVQKKFRSIPLAIACLLVLGTGAAFAQRLFHTAAHGRPEVKMFLSGTVEHGDERIPVEKSEPVKPGEILDWTIVSENKGDAPALGYKAVGKIPQGTVLVPGSTSAENSGAVAFSIDNGKTFEAKPTFAEKQADGSTKQVPAPVSMYTHLRYEWSDPLAQGGKVAASYKVRVN